MNRYSLVCLGLIAGLLSGCSSHDDWKARTHRTSGTMTINGKIPVNAIVQLLPVDQPVDSAGSRPYGLVGEDGSFSVTTYDAGDGAPIGEYHLLIVWPTFVGSQDDRLKGAFASPEKSPGKVTIERGANRIPPIELAATGLSSDVSAKNSTPVNPLDALRNVQNASKKKKK